MRPKLKTLPAPTPELANWPRPGDRSFIMPDDQFYPVARRGDTVYVTRSRHVRASGGDYILASGSPGKSRHIIVHVERATASTWEALTFGYADESRSHHQTTRRRLARAKWRPVYRCVGYLYTGRDLRRSEALAAGRAAA